MAHLGRLFHPVQIGSQNHPSLKRQHASEQALQNQAAGEDDIQGKRTRSHSLNVPSSSEGFKGTATLSLPPPSESIDRGSIHHRHRIIRAGPATQATRRVLAAKENSPLVENLDWFLPTH